MKNYYEAIEGKNSTTKNFFSRDLTFGTTTLISQIFHLNFILNDCRDIVSK